MSGTASGNMTGNMNASGSVNTGAQGMAGTSEMNSNNSMNNNYGSGSTGTNGNIHTAVNGNNYMMPRLNLYLANGSFTGYTGCNNISGKLTVNGNQLSFEDAVPATGIGCTGGFDQSAFLDRLRRANSYDVVGNQLRIKQGEQVLMVLAKNSQTTASR